MQLKENLLLTPVLKAYNQPHSLNLLKTIAYFDIFNHPLKDIEISNLLGLSLLQTQSYLSDLVSNGQLNCTANYYSLRKSIDTQIHERKLKEEEAKKYFRKLPTYAKLIKSFPFVRAISISGSLSKNVMQEDGDIDYFIITAPGRLWICRTLLILFKKVFLLNSKKYFCVNYFVDEDNLEIIDKNIFTAVEVSHLLPVYNLPLIDSFKKKNKWTESFFPGFENPIKTKQFEGNGIIKTTIESMLKGRIGDRLDLFLMRNTYKRWSKKFEHFDADKLELTMRSNRGVSKHHPRDFQNRVLKEFQVRMNQLNIQE